LQTSSIPIISIHPNYIVTYAEPEIYRVRSIKQLEAQKNLKQNSEDGIMSRKASKRVREAINWMELLAKKKKLYPNEIKSKLTFKLNFVTLTLSSTQKHTDNEIKKQCLQPFLDYARKTWKLEHYLWRAEAQKNGSIHFHICADVYLPHKEVRNAWNRIIGKMGYGEGKEWKDMEAGANSTDVHAIHKTRNIAGYLATYCAGNSKGALYTPCSWVGGRLKAEKNPGKWKLEDTPVVIWKQTKKGKPKRTVLHSVRCVYGRQWRLSQKLGKFKSVKEVVCGRMMEEVNAILNVFKAEVRKERHFQILYKPVREWMNVSSYLWEFFRESVQMMKSGLELSIEPIIHNPLAPLPHAPPPLAIQYDLFQC
jgi:hypothetical protein